MLFNILCMTYGFMCLILQILQEMELIMKCPLGTLFSTFKSRWETTWEPAILEYKKVPRDVTEISRGTYV